MKPLFCLLVIVTFCQAPTAQVVNTSYTSATGEKVLRIEFTLPVDLNAAWALFTNDEQLAKWIAPVVHMELKSGGYLVTNYNKNASLNDSTAIKLDVVNYLDKELLTLKVNLNNNFSQQLQLEDTHLQEVIRFIPVSDTKTKIVSSMIGWGSGADWDKAYNFFVMGNEWTYKELMKLFRPNVPRIN